MSERLQPNPRKAIDNFVVNFNNPNQNPQDKLCQQVDVMKAMTDNPGMDWTPMYEIYHRLNGEPQKATSYVDKAYSVKDEV